MTEFTEAAKRVAGGGDARAEAQQLVAAMTLDEKLGCLDGDVPFWPGMVAIRQGSYSYNEKTFPAAKVERLGVPGLDFADGPRGCVIGPSTVFPVAMARGASFDPELERRIGRTIGAELRAQGATFTGSPTMNLLRHPAWGRAQETYGEDPHHVGEMAAALTEGLQEHVMSCMKHFAMNSIENARFKVDVSADERPLHEVYLPHFRRVVDAGVASVMSAYNSVNGEWCGENATLLKSILREEWGFDGFVITDFGFGLRDPVKSVEAGCNIEMPFRQQRAVALGDALESGALTMEAVEERVVETIATFLRFSHAYEGGTTPEVVACAEHRSLAREAASASMVLVRNEGLLPLDATSLRRVAVLGRLADAHNTGDEGSSNILQPEVTTPLAGLRAALPEAEVSWSADDVGIAQGADAVVVVVGYTKEDEGEFLDPAWMEELSVLFPPPDHPVAGFPAAPPTAETGEPPAEMSGDTGFILSGDRTSLRLQAADEELIRQAVAVNPRTIVAIVSGSAVVIPWLDEVPAALFMWYAGMEGGHALAEVILGTKEPGGRLPFAVPEREEDLVPFDRDASEATYGLLHGQWWLDDQDVPAKLPFGFGLGYTEFRLGGAKASAGTPNPSVAVEVANVGSRHGSTVVQVYASVPGSAFERPPKRLVGFRRVALGAGEREDVVVELDTSQLAVRVDGKWVTESRPVRLSIGQSASDATLELEL